VSTRATSSRRPRARGAWLALAFTLAWLAPGARSASALDRRTEADARQSLILAAKDHAAGDDDGALLRLQRALRACGGSRCATPTRAALLRDIGAAQFARGDRAKASTSFGEALDLAADLPWNATYDAAETVAEWAAVKEERAARTEAPPEGDLDHAPEAEQAVDTPLPIYAEMSAPGVARVAVKYRVPGQTEWKRLTLPRFGGGFGRTIPCADVKRGVLRYFLQAFDAEGTPIGNSGDLHHLYSVPIRWALVGEPPHLPGRAPPEACNGNAPAEVQPEAIGPEAPADDRFVRVWIGFAASVDLTTIPSGTGVCQLSSAGQPVASSFYCTNPDGTDFPPRTTAGIASSNTGQSTGGPASGDVRLLATLDYAVSTHFLTGARFGYVDQSYPGTFAGRDGRGAPIPIHLELRETYLFGSAPLAHSGFAPYGFVSGGYAKADASELSQQGTGLVGPRPVVVWRLGGPYFVAAGGGARYAFSPRVAFLVGLKAALPFGSGGVLPSIAPEVELQYGF
jgi:hypothetical protein